MGMLMARHRRRPKASPEPKQERPDVDTLRGQALDDELRAADLSVDGTLAERRARLQDYRLGL